MLAPIPSSLVRFPLALPPVRAALFVAALSACALTGCPDPAEVGAAPGRQVEDARVRVDAAEKKLDQRAAEAAAAKAEE